MWKVMRGGFWFSSPASTRAANRSRNIPANAGFYLGFRVIRRRNSE